MSELDKARADVIAAAHGWYETWFSRRPHPEEDARIDALITAVAALRRAERAAGVPITWQMTDKDRDQLEGLRDLPKWEARQQEIETERAHLTACYQQWANVVEFLKPEESEGE